MDKIDKNLLKIPLKQRQLLLKTAKRIMQNDFKGLELKKLRNQKDLFRVRVGSYRIILIMKPGQKPKIANITKRNDKTYKNL